MAGLRVLELGCGAGLPGIVALLHGACVDFQDYVSTERRGAGALRVYSQPHRIAR